MNKAELLLPVGNVEAFYAAVEAGSDAVYLGLKKFNARGRAGNFTYKQLFSMLEIARKHKISIFVTLNTLIRNDELPELLDVLSVLNALRVDAVIFQDWGLFYLAQKYFPDLVLHASTQLGIHNSAGVLHCERQQIRRTVLARELTLTELRRIRKAVTSELEVFVHGALCYSFSGMCLFSSYLGGRGANRGLCTQPCRRLFSTDKDERFLFSLKDNQQLTLLPELQKMGIDSLKVEGRMKAAEYVYRVGKAYRRVLDNVAALKTGEEELQADFARAKTPYFLGGEVADAFTSTANTGHFIGRVSGFRGDFFILQTEAKLALGYRLRAVNRKGEQQNLKISALEKTASGYALAAHGKCVAYADAVYLAGIPEKKFATKLPERKMPFIEKQHLPHFRSADKPLRHTELYVRIDSVARLRKIRVEDYTHIILSFTKKEWQNFDFEAAFLQKNKPKFIFELPKFIQEGALGDYEKLIKSTYLKGFTQFSLSHISQKEILHKGSRFISNENVYAFNDAALAFLSSEGAQNVVYPLENDFDNLAKIKNKSGIIPLYFTPPVFVSRMPVKMDDDAFFDDRRRCFFRQVRDGVTYIYPAMPVTWLHYRERFEHLGFRRFLIDFSGNVSSKHLHKRVLQHYNEGKALQPGTSFNMKMGLK